MHEIRVANSQIMPSLPVFCELKVSEEQPPAPAVHKDEPSLSTEAMIQLRDCQIYVLIPCSSHHTAIGLPLFRHSITQPRQSWRYDSCLASFSLIPSIVGSFPTISLEVQGVLETSIDTARIPERIRFGYTWRFLRLRLRLQRSMPISFKRVR